VVLDGTKTINSEGHLEIGGCDTVKLAEQFGTPLYVFDEAVIRRNARALRESFAAHLPRSEVIYAGKSFLTTAMCKIVEQEGLGLDVVSGGELYTALKAGFPPERVYFHGNNKSEDEIRLALKAGVGRLVVDNFLELEMLREAARSLKTRARVLLRITPGIEAHTHDYVRTGQIDSKFGFTLSNGQALAAVRQAAAAPELHLMGLHCHIGSQIFEVEPFAVAARVMIGFMGEVKEEAGKILRELDLGGGFGITYTHGDRPPELSRYAAAIARAVTEACQETGLPVPKIMVEPGRSITGPAGTTLYTIGSIKEIPGVRTYLAVDGGMGDNPRTALYGAKYEAVVANKADLEPDRVVSVAGKCCESGDMLIWDVCLADPRPGDILAVFCTGAYNYSMASNYNRLPRPAAVLVNEGEADLILERESYEDLVSHDRIPGRLQGEESKAERAVL